MPEGKTRMAYENVHLEIKNQIAYITINRPKVLKSSWPSFRP